MEMMGHSRSQEWEVAASQGRSNQSSNRPPRSTELATNLSLAQTLFALQQTKGVRSIGRPTAELDSRTTEDATRRLDLTTK